MSDLDFMVVGVRPDFSGVQEDVDVYAASAQVFWERLLASDDYIQWTLRFGWILHDDGILRAASRHIQESVWGSFIGRRGFRLRCIRG